MYKYYFGYKVFPNGVILGKRGKPLSTYRTDKGYVLVRLFVDGKPTSKHLHRILAECFLERPVWCVEVDHINTIRNDNRLENLRWVTKEQNNQHSYDTGNRVVSGEKNANCKTTENIVREICEYIAQGYKPSKIRDLGYDYRLTRAINSKQNWKHISDEYFT